MRKSLRTLILAAALVFSVAALASAETRTAYVGTSGVSLQVSDANLALNLGSGFLGIAGVYHDATGDYLLGFAGTLDGPGIQALYEGTVNVKGTPVQLRVGALATGSVKLVFDVGYSF